MNNRKINNFIKDLQEIVVYKFDDDEFEYIRVKDFVKAFTKCFGDLSKEGRKKCMK